jgi:hypothetical protein
MASSNPVEYTSSLAYVPNRLVNSNIPPNDILFLKLVCTPYFNTTLATLGDYPTLEPNDIYSGISEKLATIFVPSPKQLVSSVSVKYTEDTNFATSTVGAVEGFFEWLGTGFGFGKAVASATTGQRDLDLTQSLFSSTEKRSFNFNFTLISLTKDEARIAANIANTFHAFALPSIESTLMPSTLSLGLPIPTPVDKGFSPPFWRFGIGKGLNGKIDPSWLAQPQLCVLKSVSINTAAGGSPYSIEDSDADTPKPVFTSFSLVFSEIDPSYRVANSITIKAKNAIT